MDRYKDAFYQPLVADLSNHGAWVDAGAQTSAERGTKIWKDVLSNSEPPKDRDAVRAGLAPDIEKAKAAGGATPAGGKSRLPYFLL